ncbi:MAG: hypothetical protein M3Q71_15170 [Chloroflexota bacterium]|nr:hypothetical protein [Chloroflexota bacterium]
MPSPDPYDVMRSLLSDRPIAFHPVMARVLGGVYEALLFQQLAFWSDKGADPEWIYKTREELREETTLNRYQQEQARGNLRKLGVIEEQRRGLPARMHYRIHWDRVFELLEAYRAVGRPSTNKMVEDAPTTQPKSPIQLADRQPTSESTSETTQEKKRPATLEELEEADRRWEEHRERMTRMGSLKRK